ncbi:hypothetical protein EG832_12980 [bacterium]|nr:hypothetical protein [bacterium]
MTLSILLLTSCELYDAPIANPISTQTPHLLNITPDSPQKTDDIISLGYYTGTQASYDAMLTFSSFLDIVSVDVYGLDFDGNIIGVDEFTVAAHNTSDAIQFYACINNWNSDPAVDKFDSALAQTAIVIKKDKIISQLVSLSQSEGYSGVNIDLEDIAYPGKTEEARADFSAFIHELAEKLHKTGKKLIISVPGKSTDDINNEWTYPFDLAALGKEADYLQLMTYDQHGSWGDPGPVSGVDWLQEVLNYTTSIVEPSKLLIGLPAYGYDWDLSTYDPEKWTYSTTSFSWIDVPMLYAKQGVETHWDAASHSPYVTYTENRHDHVAWFENTESITAKVKLVPQHKLGGFSVWALGMENIQFWRATENSNN